MKILKISAANFGKRGRKLLQGCTQELKPVAKYHVLAPLDLEILFHVLTNYFDLAVRLLTKLVDDKVCIEATEVVKEHWDFEAYRTLQVTLTVSSDDKPACDVVGVPDFGTLCLTLKELVTADVALSGIIIFSCWRALRRFIARFVWRIATITASHTMSVKKLGKRVLYDFHHGSLVKVIKT